MVTRADHSSEASAEDDIENFDVTTALVSSAFALAEELGSEQAARFVLGVLLVGRVAVA